VSDPTPPAGVVTVDGLFVALRELERRCQAHAVGLPQREKPPEVWAGILFRVGQIPLLANLEEIAEVLEFPRDITPVPATRTWVRGVANHRGTLLPIFDLRGLLFEAPTVRNPKNRVLVVRDAEVPFGLLVSDVTGIRRFDAAAVRQDLPDLHGAIRPLVTGSFSVGTEQYPVFSLRRMAQDARLNLAAA
jgi:twitching motility protein PilI